MSPRRVMKRLTLDEVRELLPELDELRPIFGHLMASSRPDRSRSWSGSGRLGTVGSRVVSFEALDTGEVESLAAVEAEKLALLYTWIGRALEAMASADRAGAAEAFLEAAALEETADRPERAEAYSSAAYRVSRGIRDQRPAALALRRWGRALKSLGQLTEALDCYARGHQIALALSDARGAAEGAIGAGNVLEEQGRWQEAEAWYYRALSALDAVGEPTAERWHALINLHIVARSRGAIGDSRRLLDQAALAAGEVDPEGARPFIGNARGQLAMAEGSFPEAESHFRAALAARTSTRTRVAIRLNLAEALLAQGRALDSAEEAREAEREAIATGLVPKLPEVYRLLGRIATEEGDADAFVLFERALELVRSRHLPVLEEALTLQAYSELEERRGETDVARRLRAEAEARFAEIGMRHTRQRWADVFDGSDSAQDLPTDSEES